MHDLWKLFQDKHLASNLPLKIFYERLAHFVDLHIQISQRAQTNTTVSIILFNKSLETILSEASKQSRNWQVLIEDSKGQKERTVFMQCFDNKLLSKIEKYSPSQ